LIAMAQNKDPHAKSQDIWLLLNQVEQLMMNDPDYIDAIALIGVAMHITEEVQERLESGC
jgi:hypothetical protein